MTKVGLYAIGTSTPLESNMSPGRNRKSLHSIGFRGGPMSQMVQAAHTMLSCFPVTFAHNVGMFR